MKNVEIPKWLEELPLAPEFHPTDTEFADPIAYISKIEKEASAFGICKVIPPLPKPSRKYVLHNLNKSLSKCPELGSDVNLVPSSKPGGSSRENCNRSMNGGESRAVFTTRHQELGCEKGKRVKGMVGDQLPRAQKQVWQSGEVYTLEQFEAKSKNFAKSQLGTLKEVDPLVIESMFWKAASEKPIYVEYANDVPGSGFGEPGGLLHYFHRGRRRRRRKRNSFDRNNLGSSNSKNNQVDTSKNIIADKDSGSQNTPSLREETTTNSFQSVEPNQTVFSGHKNCDGSNEMEGTAGWKLSNSPWNLQVIARSPGSLTRFMPDDIPGVTSPMVYVGMLFSWFAWHVEDHELHSLNYLHMGAPKTWYAVPGEYAFNFEEVIRLHAYGGNTDRLTALSLLGEKTTVLSPEVIVASDIPCCRLVQNPGEFVVTFPRAYHIGYSHGFNCGEAANFGTPQWLSVAKEAAFRRAAMNYLPMLSHQQLLYLLTMSFISRIPRSLLPGARSSRLRDRQKEERELMVKRAFIEDIMHENNLLTLLLHRTSSYHVVLWDMESLPSSSKESQFCGVADVVTSTSTEKLNPKIEDNLDHIEQLSQCINAVGFDLNDDDLAYDFQVDSGTLPCVACGILGFPFMAVVQPSEEASKNLLLKDLLSSPDLDILKPVESCFLSDLNPVAKGSVEEEKAKSNEKNFGRIDEIPSVAESSQSTRSSMEQSPVPDHSSAFKNETSSSTVEIENGWNLSDVFLKPRIFCLEHAIEIEELLRSKGGANVLVICHSDFQKIRAHAAVTAEEIAIPFCCNEIPLDTASQDDLNLIGSAIDSEEVDCAGDWTSQLSINLRHCVKVKKSIPSKKNQHLLNLGGLFSDVTPSPNASSLNWPSRKLRSRRHLKYLLQSKPSDPFEVVEEDLKIKLEHQVVKNEVKIIQYSRRKCKSRSCAGTEGLADTNSLVVQDILDADNKDPNSKTKDTTISILVQVENGGDSLSGPSPSDSNGIAGLQHDQPMLLSTEAYFQNSSPSHCASSLVTSTVMIEKLEMQLDICPSNERVVKDKVGSSSHGSQVHEVKLAEENIEKYGSHCFENPAGSPAAEKARCPVAENKTSDEKQIINISVMACKNIVRMAENDLEMPCSIQSDGHGVMKESSEPANSSKKFIEVDPPRCDDCMGAVFAYQLVSDGTVSKFLGSEGQSGIQADIDDQEKTVSRFTATVIESTSAMGSSKKGATVGSCKDSGKSISLLENRESDDPIFIVAESKSIMKTGIKRTREEVLPREDHSLVGGFIKGPCEGLRPRTRKDAYTKGTDDKEPVEATPNVKKLRKASDLSAPRKGKKVNQKGRYKCDLDGCTMSFQTKAEVILHKGNRCPVEGCRKKFNSHKYAIQHQRVHDDDRPLKCPWNGCTMSFKWAWARTEHLRVHTGERPYLCKVEGCGLTFRFVSDFSRHRRKTGHYVNNTA